MESNDPFWIDADKMPVTMLSKLDIQDNNKLMDFGRIAPIVNSNGFGNGNKCFDGYNAPWWQ